MSVKVQTVAVVGSMYSQAPCRPDQSAKVRTVQTRQSSLPHVWCAALWHAVLTLRVSNPENTPRPPRANRPMAPLSQVGACSRHQLWS